MERLSGRRTCASGVADAMMVIIFDQTMVLTVASTAASTVPGTVIVSVITTVPWADAASLRGPGSYSASPREFCDPAMLAVDGSPTVRPTVALTVPGAKLRCFSSLPRLRRAAPEMERLLSRQHAHLPSR